MVDKGHFIYFKHIKIFAQDHRFSTNCLQGSRILLCSLLTEPIRLVLILLLAQASNVIQPSTTSLGRTTVIQILICLFGFRPRKEADAVVWCISPQYFVIRVYTLSSSISERRQKMNSVKEDSSLQPLTLCPFLSRSFMGPIGIFKDVQGKIQVVGSTSQCLKHGVGGSGERI